MGEKRRRRKGAGKKEPSKTSAIDYFGTMFAESNRGSILVGLAEIDDALEELLSFYLKQNGPADEADWMLDSRAGDRPLASLNNRSVMACCLGLIDRHLLTMIDELRALRNARAHSTSMFALSDDDIQRVWNLLPDPEKEKKLKRWVDFWPKTVSTPMLKFIMSVYFVRRELGSQLTHLKIRSLGIEIPEQFVDKDESDNLGI